MEADGEIMMRFVRFVHSSCFVWLFAWPGWRLATACDGFGDGVRVVRGLRLPGRFRFVVVWFRVCYAGSSMFSSVR